MQLLFERLTQHDHAVADQRACVERLQRSVIDELGRIFSCKNYFDGLRDNSTILNFGLPRFPDFNRTRTEDLEFVRQAFENAIRCFEPRLLNPTVVILHPGDDARELKLHINGYVELGDDRLSVSFPVPLH